MNAPVITEYPVALECEFLEEINTENMHAIVGKIVNVSAEESVIGEKVGQAWNAGAGLMKKAAE